MNTNTVKVSNLTMNMLCSMVEIEPRKTREAKRESLSKLKEDYLTTMDKYDVEYHNCRLIYFILDALRVDRKRQEDYMDIVHYIAEDIHYGYDIYDATLNRLEDDRLTRHVIDRHVTRYNAIMQRELVDNHKDIKYMRLMVECAMMTGTSYTLGHILNRIDECLRAACYTQGEPYYCIKEMYNSTRVDNIVDAVFGENDYLDDVPQDDSKGIDWSDGFVDNNSTQNVSATSTVVESTEPTSLLGRIWNGIKKAGRFVIKTLAGIAKTFLNTLIPGICDSIADAVEDAKIQAEHETKNILHRSKEVVNKTVDKIEQKVHSKIGQISSSVDKLCREVSGIGASLMMG